MQKAFLDLIIAIPERRQGRPYGQRIQSPLSPQDRAAPCPPIYLRDGLLGTERQGLEGKWDASWFPAPAGARPETRLVRRKGERDIGPEDPVPGHEAGEAPRFYLRISAVLALPRLRAACRGVSPARLRRPLSAPMETRKAAASVSPAWAAMCRGELPR